MYLLYLGGGLDLRFRAQGLGQPMYMYTYIQFTRASYICMCTRMRAYSCIMYVLRVEGSGPDLYMHIYMHVYMYVMCTYVYVCMLMYLCRFW
jgi:hypothetical protein